MDGNQTQFIPLINDAKITFTLVIGIHIYIKSNNSLQILITTCH